MTSRATQRDGYWIFGSLFGRRHDRGRGNDRKNAGNEVSPTPYATRDQTFRGTRRLHLTDLEVVRSLSRRHLGRIAEHGGNERTQRLQPAETS